MSPGLSSDVLTPLAPLPPSLPHTAFIHPQGLNREDIAHLCQQALDLILHHSSSSAQGSPLPDSGDWVGSIAIPDRGHPINHLLAQVQTMVAAAMNPAHPGYMGHMDPLPTTVSILGDLITAALNNNMLSVEMSPVFSRLEPLVLQQMAQWFGLGARSGGLLVSGGSLGNLQALTVARNHGFPQVAEAGLGGVRPVVLASEMAHTSWRKAAMILGLGTQGVIPVATDDRGQMDLQDLQHQYQRALAAGQQPFALVGTAGTTITGNIDPLSALADFAAERGLWFHVDAAYGGALVFSPRHRHRLQGCDRAQSVTFNPQKWLYVTKTCAMVMFQHMDTLTQAFRVAAPYMGTQGNWLNLGEVSVQGTRHPDILKLWLSLQHLGHRAYGDLIDQSYDRTAYLRQGLEARPFLRLATVPEMNILCFRGEPAHLAPDQWDDWNRRLQEFLLQQVQVFVSLPYYRGGLWLKVVLLNPYTDEGILDRVLQGIDRFASLG